LTGKAPTTELTLVSKQFKHSSDLRIIGVDEAGRGPLVGSVVAAAVILPPNFHLSGLTDSKKLSEKKRDLLYQQILNNVTGLWPRQAVLRLTKLISCKQPC